ncbi:MAG: hypothetical protein V1901_04340 [Patescibacteria group bacterium]
MEIRIFIYPLKVKEFNLFRRYCDKGFEISLYWFNIIVNWESIGDQLGEFAIDNFFEKYYPKVTGSTTEIKEKINKKPTITRFKKSLKKRERKEKWIKKQ